MSRLFVSTALVRMVTLLHGGNTGMGAHASKKLRGGNGYGSCLFTPVGSFGGGTDRRDLFSDLFILGQQLEISDRPSNPRQSGRYTELAVPFFG